MVEDSELLKCLYCGKAYRPDESDQNEGTKCFGCGMALIPLMTDKTISKDTNEFCVLLGYFGIIALVCALGGIMVVHGWNIWVTFVMIGGILYLTAKLFLGKYKITCMNEQTLSEFIPGDQDTRHVTIFDQLVADAMNDLPGSLKNRLSNVSIVVEDRPSSTVLGKLGFMKNRTLLGLFEGVPLNKKSVWQPTVMPERITLFKKNIENLCYSDEEIKKKITEVVRHEVAHFVGFTEDEIKKLGY
ncbi:MAG: metallopeptidase family protein [Candidatus Brocadia sp.]|nr:MAG: metallopeptidase family protein [Candidatus Brocadia sp.]